MCVGEEESWFQLTAYEVGENLQGGAFGRCVQSSLPCVGRVDREVEAPVSPARETVLIPLKPWLQKRLRDGLTAVEIT